MNDELPEYPNVYRCTDCFNSTFKGTGVIDNTTCIEKIECIACSSTWTVKYPMSELPDLALNDIGDLKITYDIDNCNGLETQMTFTSIK